MGLEIAHEKEKRDPAFQALSSAYGSPLSPCTQSYGPPNFGPRKPRASRVFTEFGSAGSVSPVQSSARWEHTRGEEGCRRAPYSAHVQRPIQLGGVLGGGACAAYPSRGPVRSGSPGFPAASAVRCAAPSHAWDAASGCGRPVGGRAAARREEGGAVGGRRAPGPQGCCLAGGLLQRLRGACRRRDRGTSGSHAASPASRANAGRRSEGLRIRERVVVGGGRTTGPGSSRAPTDLPGAGMALVREESSAGLAGGAGLGLETRCTTWSPNGETLHDQTSSLFSL